MRTAVNRCLEKNKYFVFAHTGPLNIGFMIVVTTREELRSRYEWKKKNNKENFLNEDGSVFTFEQWLQDRSKRFGTFRPISEYMYDLLKQESRLVG